jgi:transcriptional regulator with XRE-family HTH domain
MVGDVPDAGERLTPAAAPKNALGPALKDIRLSHGWTLEDASARLYEAGMTCTVKQLEQIEAQQRSIRDFELMYFCAVLGVTQDELGEHLKQAMLQRSSLEKK